MAIAANSYGSTAGVAALTPRYAAVGGDFDGTTNPTLARVENFIDRVSAVVNAYLSQLGFVIPISQADSKLLMDNITLEHVALMVEGVRGTGRYAPTSKAVAGRGMMSILSEEIRQYLDDVAVGLEDMGAARNKSVLNRISYRSQDERGNDTFPLFQRAGFGNSPTNWDSN